MMVKIRTWVFLSVMVLSCAFAGAQQNTPRMGERDFNEYVPAPITSTGNVVCDAYFSQLEVCLKKQVPQNQYRDLEVALTQAKQEVLYRSDDPEMVGSYCQQAMDAARVAYADKGCVFN